MCQNEGGKVKIARKTHLLIMNDLKKMAQQKNNCQCKICRVRVELGKYNIYTMCSKKNKRGLLNTDFFILYVICFQSLNILTLATLKFAIRLEHADNGCQIFRQL